MDDGRRDPARLLIAAGVLVVVAGAGLALAARPAGRRVPAPATSAPALVASTAAPARPAPAVGQV
ncbi:MAG TPA: D-alanyl-D-alanine carboxypeptidase, partial [Actinomycetes bacterium]